MTEFIVTLLPDADMAAVATRLGERGFVTDSMLSELQMLVGQADPAIVPALRAIEGVESVEPSHEVRIASPDRGGT